MHFFLLCSALFRAKKKIKMKLIKQSTIIITIIVSKHIWTDLRMNWYGIYDRCFSSIWFEFALLIFSTNNIPNVKSNVHFFQIIISIIINSALLLFYRFVLGFRVWTLIFRITFSLQYVITSSICLSFYIFVHTPSKHRFDFKLVSLSF